MKSMIVILALVLAAMGCITTTAPDGTVTQRMDLASVQAALDMATQIYAMYQERNPADTESETAVSMQERIDYWTQILESLRDLQTVSRSVAPVTVTLQVPQ